MKPKYNDETILEILNRCDGRRLFSVEKAYAIYARIRKWATVHKDDTGDKIINLTAAGIAKREAMEGGAI